MSNSRIATEGGSVHDSESAAMRSAHARAHLRWRRRGERQSAGMEHISGPLARIAERLGLVIPGTEGQAGAA